MWTKNAVTQLLHLNYPVFQAGMAGGITTSELVAAVSNSGGLGQIGAGYMSIEALQKAIREVKKLTSRSFGVNLFVQDEVTVTEEEVWKAKKKLQPIQTALHLKEEPISFEVDKCLLSQQIDLIIQEKVEVCSFTFGIPSEEHIQKLKAHQIILIGTATSVEEAIANERAGMDMIVVQGSEAGGHRGSFLQGSHQPMIGTMALIPQVVDQVKIPVIAAGGIMDGRGILASLVLGASAVQMGTAFLTTIESGAKAIHKKKILEASELDLVMTRTFTGKLARGIHNTYIQQMGSNDTDILPYPYQNRLTQSIRNAAGKDQNSNYMSLWCGQNPRASRHINAADLMKNIVREVETLLDELKIHY